MPAADNPNEEESSAKRFNRRARLIARGTVSLTVLALMIPAGASASEVTLTAYVEACQPYMSVPGTSLYATGLPYPNGSLEPYVNSPYELQVAGSTWWFGVGYAQPVDWPVYMNTWYFPPGTYTVSIGDDVNFNGNLEPDEILATAAPFTVEPCPKTAAELVQELEGAAVLGKGESNSLYAKLSAAAQQKSKGNADAAANLLSAFISEVQALVESGRLTEAQGQELIAAAEREIADLAS